MRVSFTIDSISSFRMSLISMKKYIITEIRNEWNVDLVNQNWSMLEFYDHTQLWLWQIVSHVHFQSWPMVEVSTCFNQKLCSDRPEFLSVKRSLSVSFQCLSFLPQPQMYTDTYVVAWMYVWSGDLLAIGPMCAPPFPQYMWGYTLHRLSDYRSLYPPSEFSFTLHCRYDVDFVLFSGSFPGWENVAAALQLALWHDWVY